MAKEELFVLLPREAPRELEVQSLLPSATDVIRKSVPGTGETWKELTAQISSLLANSSSVVAGYEITDVTVKIGFDAKGNLGVIAVGGNASFEVKFHKKT
jgi:hypothetical protein